MDHQLFAVSVRLAEAGMSVHIQHISTMIDEKALNLANSQYANSCYKIASILANSAKVIPSLP